MIPPHYPCLPLPEPLRGTDPNSFARYTVESRMPASVDRILAENAFPAQVKASLAALRDELPHGRIRALTDRHAPDAGLWSGWIEPFLGQTWAEIPWFVAETYLFRRVAEAVGYFDPSGRRGPDPFLYQKREGLARSGADTAELARRAVSATMGPETTQRFLISALWGNQADLNLWPADEEGRPRHETDAAATAHLLADHSRRAAEHLHAAAKARVTIVADNAGFELVSDLFLVDYLLRFGLASTVEVQLKKHPTFVSDALVSDLQETIESLSGKGTSAVTGVGERLRSCLQQGTLQLVDHFFWTSPLPGWEMPADLRDRLSLSDLVISKGDANYRRLLGDLHWPVTTPFEKIVCYSPAPLLALRTLKSEVACGLPDDAPERCGEVDPEWKVGGKWAVAQFFDPRGA